MKNRKKLLFGALIMCVAGLLIMLVGIFAGGRVGFYVDMEGIHSYAQQAEEGIRLVKTEIPDFTKAEIAINYADFTIEPSDGYYLEYKLETGVSKPEYRVESKKFIFHEKNRKGIGYSFNFMSFGSMGFGSEGDSNYVKLYVPSDQYFEMISIRNSAGDIHANTLLADLVEVKADFGDVKIGSLECKKAEVVLSAGELEINKAAADDFYAENSFGDVKIEDLRGKKVELKLKAGELEVEKIAAENITADNSFGDITMYLVDSIREYDLDLETEFGDLNADGYRRSDQGQVTSHADKGKSITMHCEAGDLNLFEK